MKRMTIAVLSALAFAAPAAQAGLPPDPADPPGSSHGCPGKQDHHHALARAPRPGCPRVTRAVHANALVRIDPKTNAISHVISVGAGPRVVAVGGGSIWVYSDTARAVSEIDAATSLVRHSTPVLTRPVDLGGTAGPALAADRAGAWLVGIDRRYGPMLVRVPAGGGETREYMLNVEPRAVAVGDSAVWVVGHRPGDNELLRINKATGAVTGRTWFPDSGRVDSLTVGKGAVWVTSAQTAIVYKVDAGTMELGPHADLGDRAGRPRIAGRMLWIDVSNAGGRTLLLDGRTLDVVLTVGCCGPADSVDAYGSTWTIRRPSGTTVRWGRKRNTRSATIRLGEPPRSGGLCQTAIAAGAGSVWVTVGASRGRRCG